MGYRLQGFGIVIAAVVLTGCATQAPLDDAYYWPDKRATVKTVATESTTPASTPAVTEKKTPTMEIVSQQDTTITVRIKK